MVLKKDFKTNFRNFSKSQTSYAAPPSTRHPPQGQKQAGATEDRQLAFQWSSRALALLLNGKFEQRCVLLLQQLLHQELTTSLYSILPCLLLNILLLGGMMLSKQCGLLEKPQAVLLLITSQLSFISPPSTFKHLFLACSPIFPLLHQQGEPHRPPSLGSHCQGGTGLSHCSAAGSSRAIPNLEYCLPHLQQ